MSGINSLVSIPMLSSDITELEVKTDVAALNNGLSPSGTECSRFEELFQQQDARITIFECDDRKAGGYYL